MCKTVMLYQVPMIPIDLPPVIIIESKGLHTSAHPPKTCDYFGFFRASRRQTVADLGELRWQTKQRVLLGLLAEVMDGATPCECWRVLARFQANYCCSASVTLLEQRARLQQQYSSTAVSPRPLCVPPTSRGSVSGAESRHQEMIAEKKQDFPTVEPKE